VYTGEFNLLDPMDMYRDYTVLGPMGIQCTILCLIPVYIVCTGHWTISHHIPFMVHSTPIPSLGVYTINSLYIIHYYSISIGTVLDMDIITIR